VKPTIEEIIRLLESGGGKVYGGEKVSQLEHALQCATLAEAAEADPELITACLLHDIGHLLDGSEHNPKSLEVDFRHEERGWNFLKKTFVPDVIEPVRLHVSAKRYLCYVDKGYWETLSEVSKRSLELQGKIYTAEEAAYFISQPYAREAVQLRVWDDEAKVVGQKTPDLSHFAVIMEKCIL
jgi:phosphonate degradation associated HDIG domain protein